MAKQKFFVRSSIRMVRRLSISSDCSDLSRRSVKSLVKNSSEYWYISLIRARFAITKYSTLPLLATGLYFSRLTLIFSDVISASAFLSPIVIAVYFDWSRVKMSSSSSRISQPASDTSLRILVSVSFSCLLQSAKLMILLSFCYSSSGRSTLMTATRSWSSRPCGVTVKLRRVTLMQISGK